ncbi:hypothetical protein SH661x_003374 [Planctomicrobium sp. SH661]|uniref:hypothetical protein n=1 Tax=Planctomicrobium sp. SH661 TaxID=3448124 RepID=UPI003F5B7498
MSRPVRDLPPGASRPPPLENRNPTVSPDHQDLQTEGQNPRLLGLPGQPARVYFLIAFVAFTAAAAGWLITTFLSGWMEVAGTLAVGLFYLGLGLQELGRRPS